MAVPFFDIKSVSQLEISLPFDYVWVTKRILVESSSCVRRRD